LQTGRYLRVLIGGAVSPRHEPLLDQLDRDYRLKSSRAADGFIPGEGSAYCILEREATAKARQAPIFAVVEGVGVSDEPNPRAAGRPTAAVGLSQAVRQAAGGDVKPSGWAITDFNGERWRAKEWGLTLTRLGDTLGHDLVHWHPAASFGDLGAATMPALVCVAVDAWTKRYAPAKTALLLGTSDGSARSAILLSAPDGI
jgi:3-oxoacyl-[acyl-carrier-protein] synthase-1